MVQIKRVNIILMLAILVVGCFLLCCDYLYGGGFIVVTHHNAIMPPPYPKPIPHPRLLPTPFPLEMVYHRVHVEIKGQAAVTAIDQEFYNPTSWRLEGYYLFPLPANTVIKKFSMFVNGKEMEAVLLDAKKARRIYEDIVRRQKDPTLLEYLGKGMFKTRTFPIEPHSHRRIQISYRELLNKDNGTIEYLYPLNTKKFSAKPLKDVSINVEINSPENIKNIYCSTHEVKIANKGKKRAIVGFEETNTQPDIDFKLYYSTDNAHLGVPLQSYKKDRDEDGLKLNLNQQAIIRIILEDPNITLELLAEKVGITVRNVEENIAKLKEKGILNRIGSQKAGYWKIESKWLENLKFLKNKK